jgi:hypothetical protein
MITVMTPTSPSELYLRALRTPLGRWFWFGFLWWAATFFWFIFVVLTPLLDLWDPNGLSPTFEAWVTIAFAMILCATAATSAWALALSRRRDSGPWA